MQLRPQLQKKAESVSASRCQETFRGMFDPVTHFTTFSLPLKQQHLRTFNLRYPPLKTCQSRSTCNRKARRGGGSLSVCLTTLNLHPRPTIANAALHSDDCYFGIMSICTVLNWGPVKSRLNTALSYRAILACVSIAEWVQIWSMAMSDSRCCVLVFYLSVSTNLSFVRPRSQRLKHGNPHHLYWYLEKNPVRKYLLFNLGELAL